MERFLFILWIVLSLMSVEANAAPQCVDLLSIDDSPKTPNRSEYVNEKLTSGSSLIRSYLAKGTANGLTRRGNLEALDGVFSTDMFFGSYFIEGNMLNDTGNYLMAKSWHESPISGNITEGAFIGLIQPTRDTTEKLNTIEMEKDIQAAIERSINTIKLEYTRNGAQFLSDQVGMHFKFVDKTIKIQDGGKSTQVRVTGIIFELHRERQFDNLPSLFYHLLQKEINP